MSEFTEVPIVDLKNLVALLTAVGTHLQALDLAKAQMQMEVVHYSPLTNDVGGYVEKLEGFLKEAYYQQTLEDEEDVFDDQGEQLTLFE